MKTYLAKLIFCINRNEGLEISTFDEQVRLIHSHSQENAFHQARLIGKKEEEIFLNSENEKIHWQFVDIIELYPLEDLRHGDLVYSGTLEQEEPGVFISHIRRKAMEIQAKNLTFA